MKMNKKLEKSFNKWFNEVENFGLRSERFYDDIMTILYNPNKSASLHFDKMTAWIKAAYEEGAKKRD
jgi:hypothetical protein